MSAAGWHVLELNAKANSSIVKAVTVESLFDATVAIKARSYASSWLYWRIPKTAISFRIRFLALVAQPAALMCHLQPAFIIDKTETNQNHSQN
jgi:hypothetical protein